MTDLIAELEKRLELQFDKRFDPNGAKFTDRDFAIKRESDRLKPLHAALIECVKALKIAADEKAVTVYRNEFMEPQLLVDTLDEALANLAKVIEEMK